jgi:hypothetical protein
VIATTWNAMQDYCLLLLIGSLLINSWQAYNSLCIVCTYYLTIYIFPVLILLHLRTSFDIWKNLHSHPHPHLCIIRSMFLWPEGVADLIFFLCFSLACFLLLYQNVNYLSQKNVFNYRFILNQTILFLSSEKQLMFK